MPPSLDTYLRLLYPFPAIRGRRITRMGEASIGKFALDPATAQCLGSDNIGVFVGNSGAMERMLRVLGRLSLICPAVHWVIVLPRKTVAVTVYNWQAVEWGWRQSTRVPKYWQVGSMVFTTPEGLAAYRESAGGEQAIGAVLLVDPLCHVHKATGDLDHGPIGHNRPQLVVDFRADSAVQNWLPPFFLLATKAAKSYNTQPILSPYCLNAWWFVDGQSLRTGKPSMSHDASCADAGLG